MLEPLDSTPNFGRPTHADAVIAGCDGREGHVPFAPDREGLARTAREIGVAEFPRREVSGLLAEYNRAIGAPAEALSNAARLADSRSLVVASGQQPVAAGGPLYVLYKAATAVRLAREAETQLAVPVVPVFWNASEDHDIDEVAAAHAPSSRGEVVDLRIDLEP